MKKLGKKIDLQPETIEAYCKSCTYCGCNSGCPTYCLPASDMWAVIVYSADVNSRKSSESSNGSYASLG